jgi:CotH kinase protein
MKDTGKPLRSRLLAAPALKERYLKNVKTIAEKDLDWKDLGPVVAKYRKLIEKEVEADTRKLYSLTAFKTATSDEAPEGDRGMRGFADQRRKFLLDHAEVKKVGAAAKEEK